jgi:hypothetical protein
MKALNISYQELLAMPEGLYASVVAFLSGQGAAEREIEQAAKIQGAHGGR